MASAPPADPATQPVKRISVHRPSLGAVNVAGSAAVSGFPPPGYVRRPSDAAAGLTEATAAFQTGMTAQGYRVEQVEVPYNPAETDHVKMKPLQAGGGMAYEFSSPFGFSQGERPPPAQMVSSTMQAQGMSSNQTVSAQWRPVSMPAQQWGPPQSQQWQPYSQPPPGYGGYGAPPPQPQYAAPPPLEGWLNKKGDGGVSSGWNMRWWTLNGHAMIYSRDERGGEAGRFVLTAKCEVRPLTHPQATTDAKVLAARYPYAFEVFQGAGQRTYYLDAGSLEKRNLWLDRIAQVIGALRQAVWQPQSAPPGGYR